MKAKAEMRVVKIRRWQLDATTIDGEVVIPASMHGKTTALPLLLKVRLVVPGQTVQPGDKMTVTVEMNDA